MRYILEASDLADPSEIIETLNEIDEEAGETVMSTADRIMQRGEAVGEAKGEARGKAAMLLKLLPLRFPDVPAEAAERIRAADTETLDRWADRIATAKSIEELLEG